MTATKEETGQERPCSMAIRRYRSADREAVHRIAGDTGFFGEPIEAYLDDRRIFQDLFVAGYTDYEPQYTWVAVAEDQVVGYLTGSPDSEEHARIVRRRLLANVVRRLLRGRYRLGRKTCRAVVRLLLADLRGEFHSVDIAIYPAHLHINLAANWRGHGLGRQLMDAYLTQLRTEGVPGVHLETTTLNRRAVQLYRSAGFDLLDRRPSRVWEGLVEHPVENLLFGLQLD